ncbi:hypothetical protein L596_005646 [Steinernema carpocapsae]|uniref:Uncharacterized protein n=1 Tax=Steinernema carpocapsae TaxID=34508 RepID=A0A4U8V1A2_STECR|nr:hypothetical protein L596_005646 [Steinernema carpocapsae]
MVEAGNNIVFGKQTLFNLLKTMRNQSEQRRVNAAFKCDWSTLLKFLTTKNWKPVEGSHRKWSSIGEGGRSVGLKILGQVDIAKGQIQLKVSKC